MEDSIFTKIIKGEIPSYKIYEDDKTLAFLDIHPVQPGHTLVIPKKQVQFVWDLEDEDYVTLMNVVKKIALHLRQVTGKTYIGEKIVGVDVPHAHVQLIPFNSPTEFSREVDLNGEVNHNELKELVEKLRLK